MTGVKLSFTGHRPDKLFGYDLTHPDYNNLRLKMRQVILDVNATHIISGMALGVDTLAAELALEMKIPLIAAIPFEGQDKIWPQKSKDHYQLLLSQASEKVIVSPGGYSAYKMQVRNQWMVDQCDILCAVFDGSNGGTANCVRYAEEKNKQIVRIHPRK